MGCPDSQADTCKLIGDLPLDNEHFVRKRLKRKDQHICYSNMLDLAHNQH
jgi:hypothetical protein